MPHKLFSMSDSSNSPTVGSPDQPKPVERIIPITLESETELQPRCLRDKLLGGLQRKADPTEERPKQEEQQEEDEIVSESPTSDDPSNDNEASVGPVPEVEIPKKSVLPCNQPEKIIIVVDTAADENYSEFQLQAGESCTPLDMIKKGVEVFLYNKSCIDSRHQFALVILNGSKAIWMLDFTSDISKFLKVLEGLEECNAEDIFDLNRLFSVINEHITLLPVEDEVLIAPAYTVRTILIYARSYTIPQIARTDEVENLLSSPFFTFDILMTHEPPNTDNNCAKITKALQEVDAKGFAYFFSVARNTAEMYVAMAKLLGHPLQRPVQGVAKYVIA